MSIKVISTLRGIISVVFLMLNLIVLAPWVFVIMPFRFLLPMRAWQRCCDLMLDTLYHLWVDINGLILKHWAGLDLQLALEGQLDPKRWSVVVSNHQSWADILILHAVLNRQIPHPKFFMKRALIWQIPIAGLVCWVFGYPMIRRFTVQQMKKNPALKQVNQKSIHAACERFKAQPTALINFLEGTRFTAEKHKKTASSYQHLLAPKVKGLQMVLSHFPLGQSDLVDVSMHYAGDRPSMWDLLCGAMGPVHVRVQVSPLDDLSLLKDDAQALMQAIKTRWAAKDQWLTQQSKV